MPCGGAETQFGGGGGAAVHVGYAEHAIPRGKAGWGEGEGPGRLCAKHGPIRFFQW